MTAQLTALLLYVTPTGYYQDRLADLVKPQEVEYVKRIKGLTRGNIPGRARCPKSYVRTTRGACDSRGTGRRG